MIENTPKPQPMSNRREVREQLLKQAGWVKLPNGKWGHPDNLECTKRERNPRHRYSATVPREVALKAIMNAAVKGYEAGKKVKEQP